MKRFMLVAAALFLLTGSSIGSILAQEDDQHPVITANNASHVVQVGQIGWGWIKHVEWSSDDQWLAVTSSSGIWLYDTNDFEAAPRYLPARETALRTSQFSPDGRTLVAVSRTFDLQFWDVATLNERAVYHHEPSEHFYSPSQLVISPDSQLVAMGDWTGVIMVDMDTATEVVSLYGEICQKQGAAIAFLPGQKLAVDITSVDEGCTRLILDVTTLTDLGTFLNLHDPVIQPAVVEQRNTFDEDSWDTLHYGSPVSTLRSVDGRYLALMVCKDYMEYGYCNQDEVTIWDLTKHQAIIEWAYYNGNLSDIEFNTAGTAVAFATSNTVLIKQLPHGHLIAQLTGFGGPVTDLAFSSDSATLVTAHSDHTAWFWDLVHLSAFANVPCHGDIDLHPHDPFLVCGNSANVTTRSRKPLMVWQIRIPDDPILAAWYPNLMLVENVSFSPDGGYVILSDYDAGALVVETTAWREVSRIKGRFGAYNDVVWSASGDVVALGFPLVVLSLKEILNTPELVPEPFAMVDEMTQMIQGGIALSPDGRLVAANICQRDESVTCTHSVVQMWDAESHDIVATITDYEGGGGPMAFSPDGTVLAFSTCSHFSSPDDPRYCDESEIHLWDVENHHELVVLNGHQEEIHRLLFSPDGRWLASASGHLAYYWFAADSRDSTVRLWAVP